MLSFITDKGIQGLKAITSSSENLRSLKLKIEENAKEMNQWFYNFFVEVNVFQIQISTIINNTEGLKKCMEGLQEKVEDESHVTRNSATEIE